METYEDTIKVLNIALQSHRDQLKETEQNWANSVESIRSLEHQSQIAASTIARLQKVKLTAERLDEYLCSDKIQHLINN